MSTKQSLPLFRKILSENIIQAVVWINHLDKKQRTLSAVFTQTPYLIINVEIFNGIGPYRTLSFAYCLTPYKPKRDIFSRGWG